ncbi:MAG TPA: hypothetical protein PLB74_02730 [Candidatus Paceibacterota bacterium]|jgi:hypothetical protein|nr:hypothetical protein [Candidatus Paceibacterota bacterium]
MPDVKQAHLQTAQSPHAVQSLQKSLLCPPGKTKNLPSLKNKTLPTRNPTDKKGMKEIVDKQKGMSLDKKEGQLVTKCKCHKGFRGLRRSEVRFNFSCNLIGNHPQSLTALTLDRYRQYEIK